MKFVALVGIAALSLVALSACGSGSVAGGLAGAPEANAIAPLVRSVEVTALYGKKPLPNLQITLTRKSWPKGNLIAKGKTGKQGRVKLSGNWTDHEFICVGGRYQSSGGVTETHKCQQPFPSSIRLNFAPPTSAQR